MKIKYLVILLVVFTSITGCAVVTKSDKTSCNLSLSVSFINDTIHVYPQNNVRLTVYNKSKTTYSLPKGWLVSGVTESSGKEVWCEIVKVNIFRANEKLFTYGDDGIDLVGGPPREFIKLMPDSQKIYLHYPFMHYKIVQPGKYKIKAYVKLPGITGCELLETKWIKFTVVK